MRVSASQLGTFEQCPRKWWATWVKKIPQPPESEAIKLGKAAHKVLELALKAYKKNLDKYKDTDFLCNIIKRAFELNEEDSKLLPMLVANAKKMGWLENYNEQTTVEDEFKFQINPTVEVVGRFDRIDIDDGKVTIKDIKSGKHLYSDYDLKNNWQAKTYALPFLLKGYEIVNAEFWFIRFVNGKQNLAFRQSQKTKLLKEFNTITEQMKAYTGATRKCSKLCNWCAFQEECNKMG
jgi:RecB family exonuclease